MLLTAVLVFVVLLCNVDMSNVVTTSSLMIDYACPGRPCDCIWLKDTDDIYLECSFLFFSEDYFRRIPAEKTSYLSLTCVEDDGNSHQLWEHMFQHLKYLKMLWFKNCKIIDLPDLIFSGLESLQELKIEGATISSIHPKFLDYSPDLKLLYVIGSGVTYIPPLCSMQSLQEYNVSYNNLNNFNDSGLNCPKRYLDSLKVIDMRYNKVSVIPSIMGLSFPNLTRLTLSDNYLRKIESDSLNRLQNLMWLDLSNNSLTDLAADTLQNCSELILLALSDNPLDGLPERMIASLKSLAVLQLDNLNVSDRIWDELSSLRNVETLSLSSNLLTSIDSDVMADLSLIMYFNISNNRITKISRNVFKKQIRAFIIDLSNNYLTGIPRQTFRNQFSCEILDLSHNNIHSIGNGAFSGLRNIKLLDLSHNRLKTMPQNCLSDMDGLVSLNLSNNFLTDLPNFLAFSSLEVLNLQNNDLPKLDRTAFVGLSNLRCLNLSRNDIQHFPTGVFTDLTQVVDLDLGYNQLSHIKDDSFRGLEDINNLNLKSNNITDISFSLRNLNNLVNIDMSNNKIEELYRGQIPDSIMYINMNLNRLKYISPNTFRTMYRLRRVILTNNELRTLPKISVEVKQDLIPRPQMFIAWNRLRCDCETSWLKDIQDMNNVDDNMDFLPGFPDYRVLSCDSVYDKWMSFFRKVPRSHFLCEYKEKCDNNCPCCGFDHCYCKHVCPSPCLCLVGDGHLPIHRVHCESRNLTSVPVHLPPGATELLLESNSIAEIPKHTFLGLANVEVLYLNHSNIYSLENGSFVGLKSLKRLYLNDNFLSVIYLATFKGITQLEELYLQNNQIAFIETGSLSSFRNLLIVSLKNNFLTSVDIDDVSMLVNHSLILLSNNIWTCQMPFVCEFKQFINQHAPSIPDANNIRCQLERDYEAGPAVIPFLDYNDEIICVENNTMFTNISSNKAVHIGEVKRLTAMIGISIATLVVVVAVVLVIWKKELLQVWCFSKFGWRMLAKETKDADDKRMYDAFVCCSNKDEYFVIHELTPKLERGHKRFKLCLHFRDFTVGESIAEAIVNSIENSKRTIVVLSDNFLECEWCKFGFQTAHQQVLHERNNRMIVIVMHDMDEKRLDPQLKIHMKTRTYLKYRDPWFWEKLFFSMPDIPPEREIDQVHGNFPHHESISGFSANGRVSVISENIVNGLYEEPLPSSGVYQTLDSACGSNSENYCASHCNSSGHYEEVEPLPHVHHNHSVTATAPPLPLTAPPLPLPRNSVARKVSIKDRPV
ncbi:LOW QUALITY PROTEIN: toll-like receptor Tollo [Gigantopelta aegis]|uniref:LOW QUALITY PROTEIN: toll-like receptor Tollo n=1 Tax=Gigantopelta aegis TaxID=1735272 RepID=UPI001B88E5A1|nr:LOW QUALITY PROTEIN: toll-like receptor Tollo [Gigantopelta aegis]